MYILKDAMKKSNKYVYESMLEGTDSTITSVKTDHLSGNVRNFNVSFLCESDTVQYNDV